MSANQDLVASIFAPSVIKFTAELDSRDAKIADLTAKLAAATPAPAPVPPLASGPVAPPSPAPTGLILPTGVQLVPQNMVLGSDGIFKSSGDPLNCYVQFRRAGMTWVRIRARRKTNIIPNTKTQTSNGINYKIVRDDPGVKPNTYVAIGVSQGAWKQTTELVGGGFFNDGQWPTLPYVSDIWTYETWEFDYAGHKFAHKVGALSWAGSFDPGAGSRGAIGVQCVIATDPAPIGLPANPYTQFQILGFECR